MRPRLVAVALATALAAGVLVFDPGGWSPFGRSKWVAVAVSALGAAAVAGGVPLRLNRRVAAVWLAFGMIGQVTSVAVSASQVLVVAPNGPARANGAARPSITLVGTPG